VGVVSAGISAGRSVLIGQVEPGRGDGDTPTGDLVALVRLDADGDLVEVVSPFATEGAAVAWAWLAHCRRFVLVTARRPGLGEAPDPLAPALGRDARWMTG
jgi:hypothetical protein